MDWYLKCLSNYATFSGRARRTEYWMFVLFNVIISLICGVIDMLMMKALGFRVFLDSIYSLAVFIPGLAVSVRRLHDTGRSGWWLLLALIPILGWIVLLIFAVLDSERETNQYGPNPKLEEA